MLRSVQSMGVKQVRKIVRGQVMESFKCQQKDFELDAMGNRELVEVLKDRGDVVADWE